MFSKGAREVKKPRKPIIGVTIGDPASIGPEISIKASLEPRVLKACTPILIGDLDVLREVSGRLGLKANFRVIDSPSEAEGTGNVVNVIDLRSVDLRKLPIGEASAESGRASVRYIEAATKYALKQEISAIATAPINKKAISMAGVRYIGHTEILAALCGVEEPLTMFWVRGVKIFFLTRHVPLIDAVKYVKRDRIIDMVRRIDGALRQLGMANPRIAVAALNPHAGEGGLIGREEIEEIIPAVNELRSMGLNVVGPIPADSVFHQALEHRYDAILSLYHDQGHIAAKTIDFYGTVAVTLGLPFIRTSVDHGTAYDIAWKGVASHKSLTEAIRLAAKLSKIYSPNRLDHA